MPATQVESFCERCGTKYAFEQPQQRGRRLKGLGRTLGILADDAEPEAVGLVASRDPFHGLFHFCLECRQYTCPKCWNGEAGFCQGCVPLPEGPDLEGAEAFAAVEAATDVRQRLAELRLMDAPEAWPHADLPLREAAVEVEPEPEPVVAVVPEPEPVVAVEPEPVVAVELQPEPEPEPVVAVEPEPEPVAAVAVEPEPELEPALAVEPEPELEPALAVEAEPVAAVEPEPEPVAEGSVEPAGLFDDAWQGLTDDVPDRSLNETPGSRESREPEGVEPQPLAPAWPLPVAAVQPEPRPEPVLPMAAAPEIAVIPSALDHEPAQPPARTGHRHLSFPWSRPTPTPPPPVAPHPGEAHFAPGWQLTAPEEPSVVWPPHAPVYQPPPEPARASLLRAAQPGQQLPQQPDGALFAGALHPQHTVSGIRPCYQCALPLSASARFCRRCGALQQQPGA